MAEPFRDYFDDVFASDIHPHGHGAVIDFLDRGADDMPEVDWIATNPPFATAAEFIELGLRRARRGVAMLLRLQFLETPGRFELLYGARPMTVLAPFIERVPMHLGRWEPQGSTATAYAVFLWDKRSKPGDLPVIRPIAGGAKVRLTRADDAARFGVQADAPLLAAMGGPHGA